MHSILKKKYIYSRQRRFVSYTLNVPETVSLADLTADSRSKTPAKELLLLSSEDLVAAYEFQSASREDGGCEVVCGCEFSLSPPPTENHFCILIDILRITIFNSAFLLKYDLGCPKLSTQNKSLHQTEIIVVIEFNYTYCY